MNIYSYEINKYSGVNKQKYDYSAPLRTFVVSLQILTNMVLSYILGSFMFRMQYKQHAIGDATSDLYNVYEKVFLNKHEVARIYNQHNLHTHASKKHDHREEETHKSLKLNELAVLDNEEKCEYQGKRKKEQFELSMEMHEADLK